MFKVLDLFSGIGGFSLGLERAGMETVAFCEIEEFPRKVLAKHWPDVPIHHDIKELDGKQYRGTVDVVCGGFPCQDISYAGKGAGLDGAQSGLWKEFARVINEVRPSFAIVENTPALLNRGMGVVLRDMAAFGYDAVWHCIPASAIGSPQGRDRLWIIAYLDRNQHQDGAPSFWRETTKRLSESFADINSQRELQQSGCEQNIRGWIGNSDWWSFEPSLVRMAYGVPGGMEQIKGLGNAVVPQIPEILGRAILKVDCSHDL